MIFNLPEGLPPGQLAPQGSVGVWVSDDLPPDIEQLWMRVLKQQEATGLFPLLCWPGTPAVRAHLAEADAIDLPSVLTTDFAEYRRQRLPFWSDPTPVEVPEGIEPWPHDSGPPFESWPGLAPEMPTTPDSPSPAWAAARMAGRLAALQYYEGCRVVLAPAGRSADLPALLEWSEAPVPLLVALLRSWEERFGAQVVAVFGAELHVSVARPPRQLCDAELVALEHVLSTADNIVDDPPTPFPWYAEDLLDRTDWRFWWD